MIGSRPSPRPPNGYNTRNKVRLVCSECGKTFKDLRTHAVTHRKKRPSKCPITTCRYNSKGFARKYDRDRHALSHFNETMVCSFCPWSGTATETVFSRYDAFKKHLVTVHGIQQRPIDGEADYDSNGDEIAGTPKCNTLSVPCSICREAFPTAQDFYQHLEPCVLRTIMNKDPCESVNARRLAEVQNDLAVQHTMEKNNISNVTQGPSPIGSDRGSPPSSKDEQTGRAEEWSTSPSEWECFSPPGRSQSFHGSKVRQRKRRGRYNYPLSWGYGKDQTTLRRRVSSVFSGPLRLAKDDMMLSTEYEVRIRLFEDERFFVTDMDLQTMNRIAVFHNQHCHLSHQEANLGFGGFCI